jgi:hypothetical protein
VSLVKENNAMIHWKKVAKAVHILVSFTQGAMARTVTATSVFETLYSNY